MKLIELFIRKIIVLLGLSGISVTIGNILNKKKKLEFFQQFITKDDLVFDLGANMGEKSILFAELAKQVIAVEPQQKCYKKLLKLQKKYQNILPVHNAISNKREEKELFISNSHLVSSFNQHYIQSQIEFKRHPFYNWDNKEKTVCITYQDLVEDFGLPDFVKIDVEGFEYHVIQNIKKPVKVINFEFSVDTLDITYKCLDHLNKIGDYKCNYIYGEVSQLQLEKWVTIKKMKDLLKNQIFTDTQYWYGDIVVKLS